MLPQIYPLLSGWVENDVCTFDPAGPSGHLLAPVLFWVVRTGSTTVVFDTGASEAELALRRGHTNYRRNRGEDPLTQLGSIGLKPEDVDAVVLSHLHWDHASNWELFSKAQILVQAQEMSYAAAPEAAHQRYYDTVADPPAALPGPDAAVNGPGLVLGRPELQLVPLPGHTPGSQGLLVEAGGSRVLLAGDTVPLLRNLAGRSPRANGIATDKAAAQASIEGALRVATDVLPSHDPALTELCGADVVPHLGLLRRAWTGSPEPLTEESRTTNELRRTTP